MAYKCSFMDSEIYSAQDVNDIFARITSGGVVFTDTGYTLGDLNTAQGETVSGGVTKDTNSCLVTETSDGYKISKGVCFMNDGSAIMFDEDGQEIEITEGVINYVYLKRNETENTIDIIVSEEAGDDDSILLAEINESGEVLDRRVYARAKVDLAVYGEIRDFTASFTDCTGSISETVTVDLEDGAFSYLVIWGGMMKYGTATYNRMACGKNLITLVEGEDVTVAIGSAEWEENECAYFKKDGSKIHIYIVRPTAGAKYTLKLGVI